MMSLVYQEMRANLKLKVVSISHKTRVSFLSICYCYGFFPVAFAYIGPVMQVCYLFNLRK